MQYCMRSRRMHSNSAKEQHYSYHVYQQFNFPDSLPIQSGSTYGPPVPAKNDEITRSKNTLNPMQRRRKKK
jgi:hypothetical protein